MPIPEQKVRVLINPHSGSGPSLGRISRALLKYWDQPGVWLDIQFSHSKEDGQAKARRAVEDGVQTLLVVGGDGMINSIGTVLTGTSVVLGVIPAGSGNGFARHFNIPLDITKSIRSLANASPLAIDVGFANELPFFVTCSLAWDAALVDAFEKSPVRGVLPYLFAGIYQFFEYTPQPFTLLLDDLNPIRMEDPQLCTIANLTQFGGGAHIAPGAKADDGKLQLVTVRRKDFPNRVSMLGKMLDATIHQLRGIETRSFQTLTVQRENDGPMQLDGELLSAPAVVHIRVQPRALNVLVPDHGKK